MEGSMAKLRYMYSATNETYKDSAFTFIRDAKEAIDFAAQTTGISAGAIAGAMAEENTAYDWKDDLLDRYAKSRMLSSLGAATLPLVMDGPERDAAEVWLSTYHAELATERSHAEWQDLYREAREFQGKPTLMDKILNPALIDAGPGNFKIATAIDLIVQHAGKEQYKALNLEPYLNDYARLVNDLMHPGGELTAKLYGLYMKEHAEAFFRNNSAYAGQWDDLPQSLRDALLVTYTNLGEEKMQQLIKSPYEPQPALTSGGGMNHLRNAQAIGRAIGLEGYGQDAEAVVGAEDLVNLAKRDDATGLAARYALARLRHVVVETGVDIARHNQNGELDLYDANTAPNGMSEQYLGSGLINRDRI
ncbi:hypothetical protein CAY53_00950 [Desulfobulbus oralis]|uniref:Uncharacterized protein n=2 Tax=Desulfobulbus oralis TaxID=1986146 RepID=A0A2L1GKM0_9BACT|nr:hypothetical protein CAY53_00950 [Desulfobulbus oralis]